jgi:hypothetical protein
LPVDTSPAASTARQSAFGPVLQVDAGLLDVGYVEAGPGDGPVVLLLHGWPYDIHSFADVTPILAASGHRVIVPHLRARLASCPMTLSAMGSRRCWRSTRSR